MALRDKIIFTLLSLIAFFWFLGSISSILFPFVSAIIIAYFLDPFASKLEKYKFSRASATAIIITLFISVIILFFILVIPALYEEFVALINAIPKYSERFLHEIYPKIAAKSKEFGYEINGDFKEYLSQENIAKIFNFSQNIADGIMKSSIAVINILSLIFITPLLVFYMIKDWDLFVDTVNKHIPSKYSSKVKKIFLKIDQTLSGYMRGQVNVCFILGIFYAIGLLIIGLNFGFLIGFLTGLISFVPYVGMLIGVGSAIIIAFFQWGLDFGQIGLLALIFVAGQILESNFLTPKLVGEKIGLHPVWVIFAVFAFGILFGFVGILLAVPMAAILGVIISFIAKEYKKKFVK